MRLIHRYREGNERDFNVDCKGASSFKAFTLIELLIVVTIIALLATMMIPAATGVMSSARATTAAGGMHEMVVATITWSVDNGNRIPSPLYPGGEEAPFPENAFTTDTGLWCDGVIFKLLYPETDPANPVPSRASAGGHLIDTLFESKASVKVSPDNTNWYNHTYAMNKNLAFDELSKNSSDPWLTEKSMSNIKFLTNAMIYMDASVNVIDASMVGGGDSEGSLLGDAAARYRDKFLLVAFMDGHVVRMRPDDIPTDTSTREGSRFWLGTDPRQGGN